MSLQSQKTNNNNAAEDQNYFGPGPLTPNQQELLRFIQELRTADDSNDSEDGGRECTGEPRIDPSRQIRPNQGDSEWIEDW